MLENFQLIRVVYLKMKEVNQKKSSNLSVVILLLEKQPLEILHVVVLEVLHTAARRLDALLDRKVDTFVAETCNHTCNITVNLANYKLLTCRN